MLMDLYTQKVIIPLFSFPTQLFYCPYAWRHRVTMNIMAYDHYVAICIPLYYLLVLKKICVVQLVFVCWIRIIPVVKLITFSFCLIVDTYVNNLAVYIASVEFILVPFLLIIGIYGKITSNMLRLSSTGGSSKFSTCTSHVIVVVLFYGTAIITYAQLKSNQLQSTGMLLSPFYTILIPLLNPIIYALRNKDILIAMRKFLQWTLFMIFLFMYLGILMCNSIIILLAKTGPALQTPMYFFLSNFSFLEVCYVTATIPRMLMDLYPLKGNISLLACATQIYFVLMLGGTECLLLAAMAYDRYVTICKPLQYSLLMKDKVCLQLVAASWISGIPVEIGQTYQIFSLHFCASNKIDHFFCDIPPILKLACSDTLVNTVAVYVFVVMFVMVSFLLILISYVKIICNVMQLSSSKGRAKAFSTCSFHLIVVILFYGLANITYLQSKPNQSEGMGKLLSLFYTILIPALNPIIYTLRNKDIMMALRKLQNKLLM
ncbi:hypothetical protein U0070_018719, partial [Myodes glareolus]